MRQIALVLIILCEALIALTRNLSVSSGSLSFLSTLIVVVIVAFSFSFIFLKGLKNMALSRNYMISGSIGVVVGIFFYLWVRDNIELLLNMLQAYGIWILLVIIFLCALLLFTMPKKSASVEN